MQHQDPVNFEADTFDSVHLRASAATVDELIARMQNNEANDEKERKSSTSR